jgi:hypothetical protein
LLVARFARAIQLSSSASRVWMVSILARTNPLAFLAPTILPTAHSARAEERVHQSYAKLV